MCDSDPTTGTGHRLCRQRRFRLRFHVFVIVALVALFGLTGLECGLDGVWGVLGHARFKYDCGPEDPDFGVLFSPPLDAACFGFDHPSSALSRIAVGSYVGVGWFDSEYDDDTAYYYGPSGCTRPASDEVVEGGRLRYQGTFTLLALDCDTDVVVDFINLRGIEPTRMEIVVSDSYTRWEDDPVELRRHSQFYIGALPRAPDGWLAGQLQSIWTTSDPSVATVEESSYGLQLETHEPGEAVITAVSGELSADVRVVVGEDY